MIAVIADDLTGAAELGGIALQFDLKVEITTAVNESSDADLMIIATDTRSLPLEEALTITRRTCMQLATLEPNLIFKKIDSVLRGHVLDEIRVQQEIFNEPKALIIPANPSLGRTIANGHYLLHGAFIHESDFANDPEFPILSSGIPHMLRSREEVHILKSYDALPQSGFIVGEVLTKEDLRAWANHIDNDTVVAGAAEFFTTILEQMHLRRQQAKKALPLLNPPVLIVRGSAYYTPQNNPPVFAQGIIKLHQTPRTFTDDDWENSCDATNWIDRIIDDLNLHGAAAIGIPPKETVAYADPVLLRTKLAMACAQVALAVGLKELIIEGGSSAAAILRALDITTVYPKQALGAGVIRMGVAHRPGMHITVKPGSYAWPKALTEILPSA